MQVREKVGTSPHAVFFQWLVALDQKVGSRAEPTGQMRDEKMHVVVARSTCPSQNAQSTPALGKFWKLRCRKSARCCGAKHGSKSKWARHTKVEPLFVQMSFRAQGQGIAHLVKSEQDPRVLSQFQLQPTQRSLHTTLQLQFQLHQSRYTTFHDAKPSTLRYTALH